MKPRRSPEEIEREISAILDAWQILPEVALKLLRGS
jgi:hypothetical protein